MFLSTIQVATERWRLISALTLTGLAVGIVVTLMMPTRFVSTAQVYVATQSASDVTDLSQGAAYSQQVVKSLVTLTTSQLVIQHVKSELKLSDSVLKIANSLSVTNPLDTTIIEVTATAPSGVQAARLADAATTSLSAVVSELGPSTTSARGAIKIVQTGRASVPLLPASPNAPLIALIGLLVGLISGLAIATANDALNRKVRSVDELRSQVAHPFVGRVPLLKRGGAPVSVTALPSGSAETEAFRTIRSNLEFLARDRQASTIVIASAIQGEGKSTSAAGLATSAATTGKRTLLIDADLRRPSIGSLFDMHNRRGVTDVLFEEVDFSDVVERWGETSLYILTAGRQSENPGNLIQSDAMRELILKARAQFDMVLLDAPPILPVNDAVILAQSADALLMHCAQNHVKWRQVEAALRELDLADVTILGTVMTFSTSNLVGPYSNDTSLSTPALTERSQ